MTIKKSLKKKEVEKASEPKELEKAAFERDDKNDSSSDDSLGLTKIIGIVVQDNRNAPGSSPRPQSPIIQLASE